MADAVTTFASISADAISYHIASEMYMLSERQLVLGKLAKEYSLPQRQSKTLRVVRYKRLNNPTAPLIEGVPPDSVALATENVDVTVEQWGLLTLLTDVAMITTHHPALQIAIERVSRSISEVMEREASKVLLGGTNVIFGSGAANRAALDGTKYMITDDAQKGISMLRWNGALDYSDGRYAGVIAPQVEQDLIKDPSFNAAAVYSQVDRLNVGEVGIWSGIRWVRGNFTLVFKGVAAPGTQGAEISGYSNETGAGGAIATSLIRVVARDVQSGYERKISQDKTVAAGKDTADVTTPTSTAYVYDIYNTAAGGSTATWKLVYAGVVANTLKTLSGATYTAGTSLTPTSPPATDKEVFVCWIIGKEAFGRVTLDGMSVSSHLTEAKETWANPLAQGRKAGAKVMTKFFILNNDNFVRIEVNSRFPSNLPA